MYDIISKQLASSELLLADNEATHTPEDGMTSRQPQPFICTRKVGVSMRVHPLLIIDRVRDNLCPT